MNPINPIHQLIAAVMNAAAAKLTIKPIEGSFPSGLPQHLGQHTNPKRNAERKALKTEGRRQYRRRMHAMRMADKILSTAGVPAAETINTVEA